MTLRVRSGRTRGERSPALWIGSILLSAIVAAAVLVPLLAAHGADELVGIPFQAPSWSHPFGTDAVGRDVFVRTFAAARVDIFAAMAIVGLSLILGTAIGAASGASRRRWVDAVTMRCVDAIIAFPFLILVLALVVVLGQDRVVGPLPAGLASTIVAIVVVDWAVYARLARGQTLVLREQDYVVAARLIGYPQRQIVARHLLPSVLRFNLAYSVADVILVVILMASLSFIGAGVQPPTAEWGSMMFEGRASLSSAWWITVMPGVILAATGLSLALIADVRLARSDVRA
jgi:peptide/nickel transport system permease protein